MDFNLILTIIIINVATVFLFLKSKEKNYSLKGKFIKHSNFFLIGYFIVFFQYHIDFLLGNTDEYNSFIWVNENIVTKSLIISSCGLYSFLLGYLIKKRKRKSNSNNEIKTKHIKKNTVFLEILCIIFLGTYFYNADLTYFFNGYGKVDIGVVSSYIVVMFNSTMIAALLVKALNLKYSNSSNSIKLSLIFKKNIFLFSLLFIYLLSVLFSGDRGEIFFYIILLTAIFLNLTNRKISLFFTFTGIFLFAFLFNLLGKARAVDENSLLERIKIVSNSKENRFGSDSFLPASQNLAASIRCLHYSVDFVPRKDDFFYGRFQIQQITSVIPFFSNINKIIYSENEIKYESTANYITWIDKGNFSTSGNGTTIVSDFYLDFGIIGVVFGLFFVGYIFRWCELMLYSNSKSLISLLTSIVLLAVSVYISRGSFLINFKLILWIYFYIMLNNFIFSKKSKRILR